MDATKMATISVVDDEPSVLMLIEDALTRAGYSDVTTTTSAAEALELFDRDGPDLLILDLLMPELDGMYVLEELHGHVSEDDYVPIIVITGDMRPEAKLQALLWGAKDFVAKPFDTIELMLRVRVLLETRRLVRRLSGKG